MSNKVMIVSGGASGLGLAAAIKFAKNGYNIVLIDIDEKKGYNSRHRDSSRDNPILGFKGI